MFKPVFISVLVAATFSVTSASAAPAPDYVCESEKTNLKYEVFYTNFTEINIYNKKGKLLENLDSMSTDISFVETMPTTKVIKFIHEEGDVVAQISERGKKIKMSYEDDETITCRKGQSSDSR